MESCAQRQRNLGSSSPPEQWVRFLVAGRRRSTATLARLILAFLTVSGAGKSHTMRVLVEKGRFPLLAFVNVDPDRIRYFIPEFHIYLEHNAELAGELTRKEAGLMAEILTLAGLQAGKNVLVDGSLRDHYWYRQYFARLRSDFPALRIAILHVTAPPETVFQRAEVRGLGRIVLLLANYLLLLLTALLQERALVTGRVVPRDLLAKVLEQVPRSVKILAPLVDYHVELRNASDNDDIELVTEGETWETFKSHWVQYVQ
jgi:predicted kinase